MNDQISIQQTINRYTEGSGRGNWDRVLGTFLPDGIWEIPALGAHHQGHAAIREAMSSFVAQMSYYVQINAPAIIETAGDRATASSAVRECGKFVDRNEALEVLGFYDDELVRVENGWKFARRRFVLAGMHRFALLA